MAAAAALKERKERQAVKRRKLSHGADGIKPEDVAPSPGDAAAVPPGTDSSSPYIAEEE